MMRFKVFIYYIESLIKPRKRNMILDVRLFHLSHYSNLNKSLKHKSFQGVRFFSKLLIEHELTKCTSVDSRHSQLITKSLNEHYSAKHTYNDSKHLKFTSKLLDDHDLDDAKHLKFTSKLLNEYELTRRFSALVVYFEVIKRSWVICGLLQT